MCLCQASHHLAALEGKEIWLTCRLPCAAKDDRFALAMVIAIMLVVVAAAVFVVVNKQNCWLLVALAELAMAVVVALAVA